MNAITSRILFFASAIPLLGLAVGLGAAEPTTKNIFLLTADGLRWQEVFRGAEEMPLTKEFGNFGSSNAIRTNFWRETPKARRDALDRIRTYLRAWLRGSPICLGYTDAVEAAYRSSWRTWCASQKEA